MPHLGTTPGPFERLQAYLNDFPFRFTRRKSWDSGFWFCRLLEQASWPVRPPSESTSRATKRQTTRC